MIVLKTKQIIEKLLLLLLVLFYFGLGCTYLGVVTKCVKNKLNRHLRENWRFQ